MTEIKYTPTFTSKVIISPECYSTKCEKTRRFLRSPNFSKGVELIKSNGQKNTVVIAPERPNYFLLPKKNDIDKPVCMILKNLFRKNLKVELMTGSEKSLLLQYEILRPIYMNKSSMLKLPFRLMRKMKNFFVN